MKDSKTLHEISEEIGVSRRAVQGYEKAGLVAATGKNKYGHLLYDEYSLKRIEQIKLYQQFGFSIREICELIDAPKEVIKSALEAQVLKMKEDRVRLDELIKKAYELIDTI